MVGPIDFPSVLPESLPSTPHDSAKPDPSGPRNVYFGGFLWLGATPCRDLPMFFPAEKAPVAASNRLWLMAFVRCLRDGRCQKQWENLQKNVSQWLINGW